MKKGMCVGICLLLMVAVFAGCSTKKETEEQEVYLSIDGYGKTLLLEGKDLEGNEFQEETLSIDMAGEQGATLREIMDANAYTSITPVEPGEVFEGWMEYKVTVTTDEDGFDTYAYERVSDRLYSMEELLEKTISEDNMMYVAKWQSIPEEEYFAEEDAMWTADSRGLTLEADGGIMKFKSADGQEYESGSFTYWMDDGSAFQFVLSGQDENYAELLSVEKDGATFAGWTVYEADSVTWSKEASTEDGVMSFPSSIEDEDFAYILLEQGTECKTGVTTEELGEMVCDGKDYLAVATWK